MVTHYWLLVGSSNHNICWQGPNVDLVLPHIFNPDEHGYLFLSFCIPSVGRMASSLAKGPGFSVVIM